MGHKILNDYIAQSDNYLVGVRPTERTNGKRHIIIEDDEVVSTSLWNNNFYFWGNLKVNS